MGENVNGKAALPNKERAEKLQLFWNKLTRLQADRKWSAEKVSEIVADARDAGYSKVQVRTAIRLSRMTPEQLQAFIETHNTAAALHGFKPMLYGQNERDEKLWSFVQAAIHVYDEAKKTTEAIKELGAEVDAIGVSFATMKQLTRLMRKDPTARSNWFAELDHLGALLNVWPSDEELEGEAA